MDTFWHSCSKRLEEELPPQQFSAWIKPLFSLGLDENSQTIRISAPNRFKLDWARKNFAQRIQGLANTFFNRPVTVEFVLESAHKKEKDDPQQNTFAWVSQGTLNAQDSALSDPSKKQEANQQAVSKTKLLPPPPSVPSPSGNAKLIPSLDFDSFVLGKANNLAHAAAIQVAENPGVSYNPLYVYGGVGLGKTHLIHAIGNYILTQNSHAKIRYIHAERYVGDVVRAYQRKAFDEFKGYYRNLDVLLIDDIQFFGGKVRTQEEFFYAFEALIAAKKQVIVTCDTYPKQMNGVDERLISRFSSGLTVTIEPPELEMRVAILQKKAHLDGFTLDDTAAFFVAKHIRSNIRELEGALRKVFAYCHFHGRSVNLDSCREALKDLLSVQNQQASIENIQKTVAEFFKIKTADLFSKRRHAAITVPRQIAMYLSKELTQKSLPEIGELFGGRDHTTVLHSVRKIAKERQTNTELNHNLHVLEQTLKT